MIKSVVSKFLRPVGAVSGLLYGIPALADPVTELSHTVHNLWLLIAAALVFIMHLGFACLEASQVQPKNTVNILYKNVMILAIGLLTFAGVGFGLMYPGDAFSGGFFGFSGFGIAASGEMLTSSYNENYNYWTDFLFQAMFAATAATIASGAMAERVKLSTFLVFATIFVAVFYPVMGMWKWGGGFLDAMETPFYDFAGSTIVHGVGGWAALAGAMLLGPRIGRYSKNKEAEFVPSNHMLATIGVFLLWFGWFGFNGGSVLSAESAALSRVLMTTTLAAAAGLASAAGFSIFISKGKPSLNMTLNGALGGLVAITAGADQMGAMSAVMIGAVGGAAVVLSILLLDYLKIDDPVSAISVHLVGGIVGTLAVGVVGQLASIEQFASQLIGVIAIGAAGFSSAWILLKILDVTLGLRVSEAAELGGMDLHEHSTEDRPTVMSGWTGLGTPQVLGKE